MAKAASIPSPPTSQEAENTTPIASDIPLNDDVDMGEEDDDIIESDVRSAEDAGDNKEAVVEPKEPAKKDISLQTLLSKMDDYAPIIPDAVTAHHLLLAGLDPASTPLPLQRLLALATQKFVADIAADAYQYSRMRSQNTTSTATAVASGADSMGATGASAGDKSGKGPHGHVLGAPRAGYGGGASGASHGRAVLTMEDLGCAVGEYGVNVRRGEFYR